MQTVDIMKADGVADSTDIAMVQGLISAAAVGLFAAQAQGLIRFPAGDLTIGEIESRLDTVVGGSYQKFVEVGANLGFRKG